MDHMDGSVGSSGADAATGGGCTNKRRRLTDARGLPLEILTTEILARLPVKSLLRFRSVCKAWRAVISGDLSLVSAHLQHHQPDPSALLVFPLLLCKWQDYEHCRYAAEKDKKRICSAMAFYRWDAPLATTEITLAHAVDDMPPEPHCRRVYHDTLAYCDGLVLVATDEGAVHLFNPSARQATTLPSSPAGAAPRYTPWHQAFGLGRDPRSGAYKAARYFNRETPVAAGMEVFTVGVDRRWRELATAPAHCAAPGRTAAAFKGSLIWPVNDDEGYRNGAAPSGFLRLSLDDETLGVTPPPPCHPRLNHETCALSELRDELCCVVGPVQPDNMLEMWMTDDAVRPRWERRYAIRDTVRPPSWPAYSSPVPVAALDDGIVFYDRGPHHYDDGYAAVYSFQTREYKQIVYIGGLCGYNHRRPGASICFPLRFFVIPYRENLLQLKLEPQHPAPPDSRPVALLLRRLRQRLEEGGRTPPSPAACMHFC